MKNLYRRERSAREEIESGTVVVDEYPSVGVESLEERVNPSIFVYIACRRSLSSL